MTSVNSDETMHILQEIQPDVVIVTGTRIISGRIIDCIPAKFVNIHVGITPLYRGVHGAYWALVENSKKACGVTVHLIDTVIDTGKILGQGTIEPTKKDNFATYELYQIDVGIPLLKKSIKCLLENKIEVKPPPEGISKLWTHPTLWEYIWFRLMRGIK